MVANFVWNDIHQRELGVLYRSYGEGGLKLQDTEIKTNAFRIFWLSELFEKDAKSIERFLADTLLGKQGNIKGLKLLYASNKYDNNIENSFYKN